MNDVRRHPMTTMPAEARALKAANAISLLGTLREA